MTGDDGSLPGPAAWPLADAPALSLAAAFDRRVDATPDRTAVIDADAGESWTYATFADRVAARRAALPALEPGAQIGTLLGTGVPFAATALATWRAGATLVALNVRLDEATLADQAARAALDCLVCAPGTRETARAVAPDGVSIVSKAADGAREPRARAERSDDDEHLVLFTSGTTGRPKGVRLTARNLVASANASADRLGVASGDRWLIPLPMYHMGGLSPLVRSTLYGTTTVLQGEFDVDRTAAVIEARSITGVSLVPTMLRRLLDAGWSPPDRLRFVLLGGGPAPEALIERCETRGVPVCPTYGATETASQVATATPAEAFEHRGTVGRPLAGTDVALVDPDGGPVRTGNAGELVVDGPTVSPGYLDDGATASAFDARGFHTGDLARRDDAGRLWILGRVDDMIVTGGENVRPARVADVILAHDAVADAAVVGVPDEEWGERVAALVVPAERGLETAAIRDWCRERLADYEVPKTVRAVESVPRTASGTVDRERAREMATR
ncbi:MAG: class I adenylate-forming enzyme family protein [Haloarculaceae archaeon]